MEMRLCFSESDINDLANGYREYQGASYREREQQVIELQDDIQQRGYLTKDDLHTVAYWKSHRRAALTLENSDAFIEEVTTQAFTSTDDWEKLLVLTKLRGIGQPTASAILHLYDKGQYPILDVRALWSVGLEGETGPSYPFWLEYIAFCRDIANRNGVDMRTLDRALWFYSYDSGEA
ncbi:MAG: hypothetical protein OXI61_09925 [Candidatus Poribacteria bacterium]|nr:hypothetical protein [Candidatus Poribacteria bacterium]